MNSRFIFCVALVLVGASAQGQARRPSVDVATNVELRFVSVDCEETNAENGGGKNAVDGNPQTFWHTRWQGANPEPPHEIILELLPPSFIQGFTYLPRQDVSDHGTIKEYEFYVSGDGRHFGQPVSKGTFESGKEKKIASFELVKCRFVKLRAISEINGLPWTSAAEIDVIPGGKKASSVGAVTPNLPKIQTGARKPLSAVLYGLNARVLELSGGMPVGDEAYGSNSVIASYATTGRSKLMIIAKFYDSEAAAKAGREMDEMMVSVGPVKMEIIQGVPVHEYANYGAFGALDFQLGCYTVRIETTGHGDEDVHPLLLKVISALIAGLGSQ